MSTGLDLHGLDRDTWDTLAGGDFYSSAGWLDFCAVEHGMPVEAVVAGDGGTASVALPLSPATDVVGSPYDWNAWLARWSLPALPAGGFLVGAREGYQTHLLRAPGACTPGAVGGLLTAVRDRAAGATCVAMYLGTEDVRLLRAAGASASPVLLECDAWLPVPRGGVDAWVAGLGRKRRHSVRREMRAFEAAGYTVRHLPLRECIDAVAPLAVSTEAKYGYIATVDEDVASLRHHERCLGDAAMVALCLLDGEPVGFSLYYAWRDTVFIRWCGFDYLRLRGAYEYFNLLYYDQLLRAGDTGVRWIHAGLKATRAKVLRGAVLRPLWMLDLGTRGQPPAVRDEVRRRNAVFLDEVLADPALAGGVTDPGQWYEETTG